MLRSTATGWPFKQTRAMQRLIFDDMGEMWDESSSDLRRRLHGLYAGEGFANGLVRNLGFVSVHADGASAAVRFRTPVVSEVAIAAMLRWLWDHATERVLLTHTDDSAEQHEIVASAGAAARRIGQIVASKTPTPLFVSRACDARELSRENPLGLLLALWSSLGGALDWRAQSDFLADQLGERFIVLSAASSQSELYIAGAGRGLRVPGFNWFLANIGAPLGLLPDGHYRHRVSEGYYHALRTGEPYCEVIEAAIYWPNHGLVQRKYERIILRCPARAGSTELLGATRVCA